MLNRVLAVCGVKQERGPAAPSAGEWRPLESEFLGPDEQPKSSDIGKNKGRRSATAECLPKENKKISLSSD